VVALKVSTHRGLVEALSEITAPINESPKEHPVVSELKDEDHCNDT